MPEKPYNKREIDILMKSFGEKLTEHHNVILKELEEIKADGKETKMQAKKTNGQVTKHTVYFKVAWWVLGAVWTVLLLAVPLVIKLARHEAQVMIDSRLLELE